MTIGLNLSFLPPAAAMPSVQQNPSCAWGCALPMQPIPDTIDAWRCVGCGSIALRDPAGRDESTRDAIALTDAIDGSIQQLQSLVELLAGYTQDTLLPAGAPLVSFRDAVTIECNIRRVLGLLRSDAIASHADAVHAMAIEAAARICDRRGASHFRDSGNGLAFLEAQKCALAIRTIQTRGTLARRPELVAPDARSATEVS